MGDPFQCLSQSSALLSLEFLRSVGIGITDSSLDDSVRFNWRITGDAQRWEFCRVENQFLVFGRVGRRLFKCEVVQVHLLEILVDADPEPGKNLSHCVPVEGVGWKAARPATGNSCEGSSAAVGSSRLAVWLGIWWWWLWC